MNRYSLIQNFLHPLTRAFALIALLGIVTACGGKSVEEHLNLAQQFRASGDYQSATIELKNALQQDGKSAQARWLLGQTHLDLGDTASAVKELEHADHLGWSNDDVTPALAYALLAQHEYVKVRELSRVGLSTKADAKLLAIKAQSELAQGEITVARELLAKALLKAPQDHDIQIAQARIQAAGGNLGGALLILEDLLEDAPKYDPAWSLIGDIRLRQQELNEALAAYNKAISLNRHGIEQRFKRALIHIQQNNFEAAAKDAKALIGAAPQSPASNYVQGMIHYQEKRYEEAVTTLSVAESASNQFPLILLYLGSAHWFLGNQDQAAAFANHFVDAAPGNIAGRKLLATVRLVKGRYDDVVELLQPVIDNNPKEVDALNLMANAKLQSGKTDEGLSLLARVAKLQPDSAAAQVRLGAGLLMSGKSDDATTHIESAIDLDPKFQQADILLVLRYLQDKDYKRAIDAAENYRKRNPGSITPQNLLGRVHLAAGDSDKAKEYFEKALVLEPGDPSAHHNLAQLALAAKEFASARNHYLQILEHHKDFVPALLQLARLDARESDETALVSRLEQAIKISPTLVEPRILLGRYYLGKNKHAMVAPLLSPLSEVQKQSPQALELQALAQLAANNNSEAVYTAEQLVAADPETAGNHYLMALAAGREGNTEKAEHELLQALELDPRHFSSLLVMARLAFDSGDSEFQRYLNTLMGIAPEHPDVLQLQARQSWREGEKQKALAVVQKAFKLAPNTKTMLNLSYYLLNVEGAEPVSELIRSWIADHPSDLQARMALADHLQQNGHIEAAMATYDEILELTPDNMVALNNQAWHLRLSAPAKALEYARRASALAPNRPEVLDTLGVIQYHNQDMTRARRSIERAIKGAPENRSMQYHLAMVEVAQGNTENALVLLTSVLSASGPFQGRADAEALLASLR